MNSNFRNFAIWVFILLLLAVGDELGADHGNVRIDACALERVGGRV